MLTRVTLCLSELELNALRALAEREMRGLREQARFLVCAELLRLGLLASEARRPGLRGELPVDAAIGEWMLG